MSSLENKVSTSIRAKSRLQALGSHFEMACIFSLMVIGADMMWLIHDILVNGMSMVYGAIATLMLIGFTGTAYVTVMHNRSMTSKKCHSILIQKLDILKRKHVSKQRAIRVAKAKDRHNVHN